MIRLLTLCLIVAVILPVKNIFAQYLPTDWSSTVETGQGGGPTAWANDGTSIFYNPAGLSMLHNKHSKHTLFGARSPIPDELELNNQMGTKLELDPDSWFKNLLESAHLNPGKPSYIAAQAFPFLVLGGKNAPTFLIGFPLRSENSAVFLDTSHTNNATVKSITTASGAISLADSTQLGVFRWGVSVRPNYRVEYSSTTFDYTQNLKTQKFIETVGQYGERTTAVAMDAGFMLTLADYWFPSLGISVRNIPSGCAINYVDPITFKKETMCGTIRAGGKETSSNESRVDPTEVRIGVALTPRFKIAKSMLNIKLTADAYPLPITIADRNYGIPSIDLADLIHVGGELFFGNPLLRSPFVVRGGYMNQQYTWGGSIDFLLFSIGYSSYVAKNYLQDSVGKISTNSERRHSIYLGFQF